jgi:hypothetical protein
MVVNDLNQILVHFGDANLSQKHITTISSNIRVRLKANRSFGNVSVKHMGTILTNTNMLHGE